MNRGNNDFPALLRDFRVVILPGNRPPPQQILEYKSAYATWKSVWAKTFKELDGADKIYSDDFTRQDELICIFKGDICIAMGVMRWVNIELPAAHEDSYFKVWPESALKALGSRGSDVIVCSNLTVHEMARGGAMGMSMKDVMVGILVQRLLQSGANAMTGTMRVDRGAHKTTYQFGAEKLIENLSLHGVPVDLVAFFPDQMIAADDANISTPVKILWEKYLVGQKQNKLKLLS